MIVDERYINLASEIVKRAMLDYKKALREQNKRKINECERFFLSEYGQLLSANNGEYAIERCKKEVESEKRKRIGVI